MTTLAAAGACAGSCGAGLAGARRAARSRNERTSASQSASRLAATRNGESISSGSARNRRLRKSMSTGGRFRAEADLLAQLDPARRLIQRQLAGNAGQLFAQSGHLAVEALCPRGAVRQVGLGSVQQIDCAFLFG